MIEVKANANGKIEIFKDGELVNTPGLVISRANGNSIFSNKGNGKLVNFAGKLYVVAEDGNLIQIEA